MTYIQAFEKIKEMLKAVDSSKFTSDFAIQINLKNKDCSGALYIANLDGVFSVEPYDYRDNYALLTIMLGDLTKLFEGKLKLDEALKGEKLDIIGSFDAVMQLSGIVTPAKKAAPKKPAVKKAAPKKAATKKESPKKAEPKAAEKKADSKKEAAKPSAKKTASVKKDSQPKKASDVTAK